MLAFERRHSLVTMLGAEAVENIAAHPLSLWRQGFCESVAFEIVHDQGVIVPGAVRLAPISSWRPTWQRCLICGHELVGARKPRNGIRFCPGRLK